MPSPTADRKYVRVYYDLIPEFPDVYADDGALAAWLRLLMVADAMWPVVPELPRSIKPRPLRVLVDAGLVTMRGHFYSIRGLNAERTRRAESARNAAAKRWHSGGNADGNAEPVPRRAKTRQDEDETETKGSQGLVHIEGGRANGPANPAGKSA